MRKRKGPVLRNSVEEGKGVSGQLNSLVPGLGRCGMAVAGPGRLSGVLRKWDTHVLKGSIHVLRGSILKLIGSQTLGRKEDELLKPAQEQTVTNWSWMEVG